MREEQLAHRGAVRGQAGAEGEAEVDPLLAATVAARARDVDDLGAVEHGDVDGVTGAPAQFLQIGLGVLAQAGGVQRRHSQVGDVQAETVLARCALLEVAEGDEGDDVAVRGGAAHAERVGDVRDPEHGAIGGEA